MNIEILLSKYNQEHIFEEYKKLKGEEKMAFENQITKIDFDKLGKLYELTKKENDVAYCNIEPMQYTDATKLSESERLMYVSKGEEIIKNGKYAVITLAGGQGTRLGHNGPKGTFDLGLDSHKSIFEILCDKLKEASAKYDVVIPWYIMTSKENNSDTIKFFEKNNYFGYEKGIKGNFFIQKEMPMLNMEGKLIIDKNHTIKEAANGHGGIFEALVSGEIFKDIKERKIEWLYVSGVDNILAKLIDPLVVGFSICKNYEATSISVEKTAPEEKVGVFCYKNGKPSVIEYTELNKELSEKRTDDGRLLYGSGHMMMNLFNIRVIEDVADSELPYHVAFKKCNYINKDGEYVEVDKPNAYKFETFLFDVFERLKDMGILRYKREECFAPLKNAMGEDSVETVKKMYQKFLNK